MMKRLEASVRSNGAGKAAATAVATLLMLICAGCRQDMQNQPKMIPQRGTTFFSDGRSSRPQVPGTVARTQADSGTFFLTGLVNGKEADGIPFAVTPAVMARGQERFNIYCTPCHSRVGNGQGAIVQRGYYTAGDLQSLRLRQAALGHFFYVMTNGYGAMPDYAAQITPQDRWAIVAYIRALQLSQSATPADIETGAAVSNLGDLAEKSGYPRNFAMQWTAPAAAPPPTQPSSAASATADNSPVASSTPGSPASGAASAKAGAAPSAEEAAPVKAAAPKGDAVAGKALFMANCSPCHQPTRLGLPPVIPALIGVVDKLGADQVRTIVGTGFPAAKPPMPAFVQFSSTDVDNLIAFLRTAP